MIVNTAFSYQLCDKIYTIIVGNIWLSTVVVFGFVMVLSDVLIILYQKYLLLYSMHQLFIVSDVFISVVKFLLYCLFCLSSV